MCARSHRKPARWRQPRGNSLGTSPRRTRNRHSVPLSDAHGPFTVDAERWYQPIAYRWAHNLDRYDSGETKRFVSYYKSLSDRIMIKLAGATITVDGGGSQNMHALRERGSVLPQARRLQTLQPFQDAPFAVQRRGFVPTLHDHVCALRMVGRAGEGVTRSALGHPAFPADEP